MSTTEIGQPGAKLVLPGSGSIPATVEVIYQSQATRLSRALIILAVSILISPVLFFLPPHFLWPLVSLAAGGYLAWRYWTGEYYVTHFEGACPRCDTPLEMKRGTRIRGRHTLDCHGCHRQPTLILDDPEHPPEEPSEPASPTAPEVPEVTEVPTESPAAAAAVEPAAKAEPTAAAEPAASNALPEPEVAPAGMSRREDDGGDRRARGGDRRSSVADERAASPPDPGTGSEKAIPGDPVSRPDVLDR